MTEPGTYLRLMRARFERRLPEIDPVPWHLDDKDTAYRYVEERGYRTPRRVKTTSAQAALEAGRAMGDRFVVKQTNRHSAMGVYVLESLGGDNYLEMMSLEEKTAAQIVPVGTEPDYWLAEEFVESGIEGHPVPFDYKFYSFHGEVTHVLQVDRNALPAGVAFFDGNFMPLEPRKDYFLDLERFRYGHHVLPRHAGRLLDMAKELSASFETRFVRIDTYDTPEGPVFGEFTFAAGSDDVRSITYSDRVLALLDDAMSGEPTANLSGFGAPAPVGTVLSGPEAVLSRLAAGAAEGDRRYGRCALPYVRPEAKLTATLALAAIGYLNGDGTRAFTIQSLLRDSRLSKDRLPEFVDCALKFHDARAATGNQWDAARAAQIRLAEGTAGALDTLRELAAAGSRHAADVLASHDRVAAPSA